MPGWLIHALINLATIGLFVFLLILLQMPISLRLTLSLGLLQLSKPHLLRPSLQIFSGMPSISREVFLVYSLSVSIFL